MGWGNFQGLGNEERPLTQLRLATQHGDGSLQWVLEGCGHLEPGRNPHPHPPTPPKRERSRESPCLQRIDQEGQVGPLFTKYELWKGCEVHGVGLLSKFF